MPNSSLTEHQSLENQIGEAYLKTYDIEHTLKGELALLGVSNAQHFKMQNIKRKTFGPGATKNAAMQYMKRVARSKLASP